MKTPCFGAVALTALVFALAVPAQAQTAAASAFPAVSGEVAVELHGDRTEAEDGVDSAEAAVVIEPTLTLALTPELSLRAGLTLETVRDGDPGQDRAFDDHGLYVGELVVAYDTDRFGVFAGKFTPNFGIAWDAAPGLYGTDLAEDYQLSERIGFGGKVAFGTGAAGRHAISASAFMADVSGLSDSALTRRGRTATSDGGPSNTGTPSSFAVALDGGEIPAAPGLRYHLGWAHQGVDRVNDDNGDPKPADRIDDEDGVALGLEYAFAVAPELTVTPIVEWVRVFDFGGDDGIGRDYLTGGVGVGWGAWNVAVAATGRWTDNRAEPDAEDHQVQVSVGYAFESGIGIDVGAKHADDGDAQSWTVGAMLGYTLTF